jgi:hypothetical protein
MRRRVAIVLLLTPPLGLLVARAGEAETTVTLTPASGPAGTVAQLRGAHFRPRHRVVVKVDRRSVASTRTDGGGAFQASIGLHEAGRGSLQISSSSRSRRVVNVFVLSDSRPGANSGEVASQAGERLRWSRSAGPAGSAVGLRGAHFPSERRVRIDFGGVRLRGGRTSAGGTFSKRLTVPNLSHRASPSDGQGRFALPEVQLQGFAK